MKKFFCSFALMCLMVCGLVSVFPQRVSADMISYSDYPKVESDSFNVAKWVRTTDYTYTSIYGFKNVSFSSDFYVLAVHVVNSDEDIYQFVLFSSSPFSYSMGSGWGTSSSDVFNGKKYNSSLYYDVSNRIYNWLNDSYYGYGSRTSVFDIYVPIYESNVRFGNSSYTLTDSSQVAVLNSILNNTFDEDFFGGISGLTFDSDSAEYDTDLGYLQNVSVTRSSVDQGQHSMPVTKINFSTTTSTGVDLRQDGYDVEYYLTMQSYKDGSLYSSASTDSMIVSNNDCGSSESCISSISSGALYITGACDPYQNLYDEVTSGLSSFSTATVYLQIWMRPVYFDGSSSFYGQWTKITSDGSTNALTGKYTVDVVTGTTDDGKVNTSGDLDNITASSSQTGTAGSGDTYESASSSSTPSHEVDSSSSDLWANAETMLNGIGNVPLIVASVFSFLPTWCLGFVAVAFGLIVLLIIYKLVRG